MKKRRIGAIVLLAALLLTGLPVRGLEGVLQNPETVRAEEAVQSGGQQDKEETAAGSELQDEDETKEMLCDQPSKEDLEKWEEDGSLEARQEYAQRLEYPAVFDVNTDIVEAVDEKTVDKNDIMMFQDAMPSTGNVKALVLMVEFSDVRNTDAGMTPESVKQKLFGKNNQNSKLDRSMADYYKTASYGKLNLSGDVYGWYTLKNTRDYYANDAEYGYEEILNEVLKGYDDTIDYSDYDSDNDGVIDALYVVYAGKADSWGTFYWSCQTWAGEGQIDTYDNTQVKKFVFEAANTNETGDLNITSTHETGHLLGLPDLYDRDGSRMTAGGAGYFDMMDHNVGDFNIFSKMLLGWVDYEYVNQNHILNLKATSDSGAKAYIITNSAKPDIFSEYYMVELYNNEGNNDPGYSWIYKPQCPDGAVRIWHVNAELEKIGDDSNYYYDYKQSNTNFNETKFLSPVQSGGSDDCMICGFPVEREDYYYAGMNFGVNTMPGSEFYGKKFTGINIHVDEVRKDDAKVTVTFDNEDQTAPEVTEANIPSVLGKCSTLSNSEFRFSSYIYESDNFQNIKCYEKDHKENEIGITFGILKGPGENSSNKVYSNRLYIDSAESLEAGKSYIISFPEGAVEDAGGNKNKAYEKEITACPDDAQRLISKNSIDYESLPEGADEKYSSHGFTYKTIILKDGSILFAEARDNFDDASDKTLIVIKKYDTDGNLTLETYFNISNTDKNMQLAKELDNGNYLLVTDKLYLIVDKNGELVSENEPFKDVDDGHIANFMQIVERSACVDFVNWDQGPENVCCVSLQDGSEQRRHGKKEVTIRCYNEDGSISGYSTITVGVDWCRFYDDAYKVFDDKAYHDKYYSNSRHLISDYLSKNKNEFSSNSYGYERYQDSSVYIQEYVYSKSSNIKACTVDTNSRGLCTGKDKSDFYLQMKLANTTAGSMDGMELNKIKDGYILTVTPHNTNAYICKLDDAFNVNWMYETDQDISIISASEVDDTVVIISNTGILKLDDTPAEENILSSKEFTFQDDNIDVDDDNHTITLKDTASCKDIRTYVKGNYSDVAFYDENLDVVADETQDVNTGYVSVTSENGVYKWFYKIKSGHIWDDGKITKEATCSSKGIKTYTCTLCGETRTEETEIDPSAHDVVTDAAAAPTCTNEGITEGAHCRLCGKILTAQETVPAAGHAFGEWQSVTSPNCTDQGSRKRVCQVCGYEETADVAAYGHDWETDYTVDQEAACTTDGSRSIHCKNCDATKDSEVIPATGHTVVTDEAVEASCTTEGKTAGSHCLVCNMVLTAQEEIPETDHNYSEWKITRKPTALKAGKQTRTCQVCSEEETESLDRLKATVKLSATKKTLKVKKSFTLKVSGLAYGDSVKSFKSSKKKVAAVNKKGKITARKKGTATITVTLKSGKTAKCKITVK